MAYNTYTELVVYYGLPAMPLPSFTFGVVPILGYNRYACTFIPTQTFQKNIPLCSRACFCLLPDGKRSADTLPLPPIGGHARSTSMVL